MIVVVKCHSKQTPAEYKAKQDLTCSIYMLAGQSRLGDLHPRKKLSLSNQLGRKERLTLGMSPADP